MKKCSYSVLWCSAISHYFAMSAYSIRAPVQVQAALFLIQLPTNSWGPSTWASGTQGKTRPEFLALAWPSPGCCSYLIVSQRCHICMC